MTQKLVDFTILDNGDLKIALTRDGREELAYWTAIDKSTREAIERLAELQTPEVHTANGLVMGPRTLYNTEISQKIKAISQFAKSDEDRFIDLIEYQLGNGWDLVSAEDIGALTGALILATNAEFNDMGEVTDFAQCWIYSAYQIYSYLEDLQTQGYVIWEKASE